MSKYSVILFSMMSMVFYSCSTSYSGNNCTTTCSNLEKLCQYNEVDMYEWESPCDCPIKNRGSSLSSLPRMTINGVRLNLKDYPHVMRCCDIAESLLAEEKVENYSVNPNDMSDPDNVILSFEINPFKIDFRPRIEICYFKQDYFSSELPNQGELQKLFDGFIDRVLKESGFTANERKREQSADTSCTYSYITDNGMTKSLNVHHLLFENDNLISIRWWKPVAFDNEDKEKVVKFFSDFKFDDQSAIVVKSQK